MYTKAYYNGKRWIYLHENYEHYVNEKVQEVRLIKEQKAVDFPTTDVPVMWNAGNVVPFDGEKYIPLKNKKIA